MGDKKIYSSFITEELETILYAILERRNNDNIHVAPFKRYGFSGSNLYLIYFSKENRDGLPYLLKTFTDGDKAKKESEAMKLFKDKYRWAKGEEYSNSKLHGILLEAHSPDASSEHANDPMTFKKIMYEWKNEEICELLKKMFDEFGQVYKNTTTESCNILHSYSKYLRNDETKNIIGKLTKDNINNEKIKFFGKEIMNPVYVKKHLIKETPITKSLIHGDLHTDNIVIDHQKCPRIVDFAWACKNDIYIDFSLFEMSVRYWQPSFFMSSEAKDNLEKVLLNENFDINNIDTKNKDIRKMMLIVSEIRKWCRQIIGSNYDFKHHLLSQFIVLYGLQKYTDSYNPYVVIPFLAKLGKKIKEFGYVNGR